MQIEFQEKINKIIEKYELEKRDLESDLQDYKENNGKLLSIIKQKEKDSTQVMKPPMIKQIKGKIDLVIETLSQQNDPQKLHSVAKELLFLQKMIKDVANNNVSSEKKLIYAWVHIQYSRSFIYLIIDIFFHRTPFLTHPPT